MQVGPEYWIKREYMRRKSRNPAYSLRAFSLDVGVSPSRLSQALNGQRQISRKMALKIVDHIELSQPEYFAYIKALSIRSKSTSNEKLDSEKLVVDKKNFELIADPLHFAILSLVETVGFQSKNEWIANRLKSDVISVRLAIENLIDLNFLKNVDGKLVLTHKSGIQTTDHEVNRALRKSHKKQLEHAIQCLETVPIELRDFTSEFMAIDVALLPEAKKLIRQFRKKLSKILESQEKKEVYQLSVQLVPLTQLRGRKNQ